MFGIHMNGTKVAVFGCFACVASFAIGGLLGFVAGGFRGTWDAYDARFDQESMIMHEILTLHPDWSTVKVEKTSRGLAILEGRVNDESQREELKAAVAEQFGQELLDIRTNAVEIKRPDL